MMPPTNTPTEFVFLLNIPRSIRQSSGLPRPFTNLLTMANTLFDLQTGIRTKASDVETTPMVKESHFDDNVADYLKGVTSLWDKLPSWIQEYKVVALWAVASLLSIPLFLNGAWLGTRLGRDISGASSQNFAETHWVVSFRRIIRTTVRLITLGLLLLEYTFLSSLLVFNWYMFIGMIVIFILAYFVWHDQFKTLATDAQDTLNSLMNGEDDGRDEVESVLLFSNHEFHLKVPKTSGCIGIPFNQLHLRNQTGATVSRIVRKDGVRLNNPGANASFRTYPLGIF